MVQLFSEVRKHKPSVIYIPNVDNWYSTVGSTVISTFIGLLRTLPPTDPVLLLGVLESEPEYVNKTMLRDLFGFSKKNQFELTKPQEVSILILIYRSHQLQANLNIGMAARVFHTHNQLSQAGTSRIS